jgi:hypothetical protein
MYLCSQITLPYFITSSFIPSQPFLSGSLLLNKQAWSLKDMDMQNRKKAFHRNDTHGRATEQQFYQNVSYYPVSEIIFKHYCVQKM